MQFIKYQIKYSNHISETFSEASCTTNQRYLLSVKFTWGSKTEQVLDKIQEKSYFSSINMQSL
jgi:hypothetical protein